MEHKDLERLKAEYRQRAENLDEDQLYSLFNKSHLFTIQQRTREVLDILRKTGFQPLSEKKILEVGCGRGGVLLEYLSFGASAMNLHGCDLLPERIQQARPKLPSSLALTVANGQCLPYPTRYFDLVLHYTVFSSILSDSIRHDLASEMLRVLRPGGMVLWYDFWLNPTNRQTRGIRPSELRQLFPACEVKTRKVTLAPPLARRMVPISWLWSLALEKIGILNTHYLAVIRLS